MLLGFALVLTRISSFLLVLPVFGAKAIPMQIKAAAAVLLSLFFCTTAPLGIDPAQISTLGALLLLAGEAIYGLALGLIVALLFSVVQLSGHVIEQQMGLTMAEIVDPLTDEEVGPLASLLEMIFLLLFLSANGHHLFLLILSKSYSVFPAGTIPTLGAAGRRRRRDRFGHVRRVSASGGPDARGVPDPDGGPGAAGPADPGDGYLLHQHAGAGGPRLVPGRRLHALRGRIRDRNGRLDGETVTAIGD